MRSGTRRTGCLTTAQLDPDDRALTAYTRRLQFRRQLVARLQDNNDEVTVLLNLRPPSELKDGAADADAADVASKATFAPAAPSGSSAASSVAGSPAKSHVEDLTPEQYSTRVRAMKFHQLVDEQKGRKPFEGKTEHFMSKAALEEMKITVYDVDAQEKFDTLIEEWTNAVQLACQLIAAYHQSCVDVASHINTKVREKARQAKFALQQQTAAELKKVREEAKAAADTIKAKLEAQKKPSLDPVFQANYAELDKVVTVASDAEERSWEQPWVVLKSESAQLWSGNPQVQKFLAGWGATYKKDKATAETGRAQRVVDAKQCGDVTEEFFKKHLPEKIVDISAVDGGDAFMKNAWVYGFSPSMHHVGLTPNAAACVKALALGVSNVLLVEVESYLKACKPDPEANLDFLDDIAKLSGENLIALKGKGVQMRWHKHERGQLLFIPAGWIVVEYAPTTNTLLYGVRKSFFTSDAPAKSRYAKLIDLYQKPGKNASRMKAIQQLMA